MNKLKIGYFADGPWSHSAFELIQEDLRFEIQFIVPRKQTSDKKLEEYASKYNIDFLRNVSVNSDEFLELIKKYNCDIFVSMSFDQIFKKRILEFPPIGIINCHAGKLPFYRGRNILNWALINGETEFGITVHFVDEGIDTGDIILQKTYEIKESDTYATLLQKAHKECANILFEALINIHNSSYQRIDQKIIHPTGFYCGIRGAGDEIINWNSTSEEVFNFVRAICKPGPMAITYLNEEEVKINKARLIKSAPKYIGTSGQLISKTAEGFLVKTRDSFLEIFEIESKSKLRVGNKFGK